MAALRSDHILVMGVPYTTSGAQGGRRGESDPSLRSNSATESLGGGALSALVHEAPEGAVLLLASTPLISFISSGIDSTGILYHHFWHRLHWYPLSSLLASTPLVSFIISSGIDSTGILYHLFCLHCHGDKCLCCQHLPGLAEN